MSVSMNSRVGLHPEVQCNWTVTPARGKDTVREHGRSAHAPPIGASHSPFKLQ